MACTIQYVNNKTISISQTFVLFDRNSTFTGIRDPRDFNYLLLNEIAIYRNGKREFITHRLTAEQVNKLFCSLDTNNFRHCMCVIPKTIY
jgi:hypothetical protein